MIAAAGTRRSFMTASLAAASALLVAPRAGAGRAAPAGAAPGQIALYNIHTREALTVAYRDDAGRYDRDELDRLNHDRRAIRRPLPRPGAPGGARLERGGVGFYPASDFIHLDCGRVRSW